MPPGWVGPGAAGWTVSHRLSDDCAGPAERTRCTAADPPSPTSVLFRGFGAHERVGAGRADPVYSDADGDGFPDAAVKIAVNDGHGFEALWYILLWDNLLWDNATQQPVQIDDPFARTFRCGDVVDLVDAASRGFTVAEHRTDGQLATCADQSPIAITRTVGVRDGWLAELSPNEGCGGICPDLLGNQRT